MNTPLPSLVLGLLLTIGPMAHAAPATPSTLGEPGLQSASADLRNVARWVVESGDNAAMPFLLVDKVNAQVFVFDARGRLQGSAPALLGMARGDRLLAPNNATLAQIRPSERITPAGRYVSRLSVDSDGKELLVLDYAAAISLHPVIKGTPEERRAERLGSATSQDNRISYGCINVPKDFYSNAVRTTFAGTRGVVYVLPEMGSAAALFGMRQSSTLASSGSGAMQGPSAP
jgi:hypothetical protein